MTRLLAFAALGLGIAGALWGAVEVYSLVLSTFAYLYAYAFAQSALCGLAVLFVHRAFRAEIRSDPRNWHRPVLRAAPPWAKAIALLGLAGSLGYLLLAVGGGVELADWAGAKPEERAALFVGFSLFNYPAFVGLLAASTRAS